MFEINHSLLNRKLLHLTTVVTFQNVNVPAHCQSLWSSTLIHDMMSLAITAGITGLFCEYSKLLNTTSTVRRLVVLGRSYKCQVLWTGFGKMLQVFWNQLSKMKVLHSLRTSGNTPQMSASHSKTPKSSTTTLCQPQISCVYRTLQSLCFLW